MTSTYSVKMTLVLPSHHKWLNGLRGSSMVVEYLLDQEFGTEVGTDQETTDRLAADKIVKAQKIIEKMRARKQKKRKETG